MRRRFKLLRQPVDAADLGGFDFTGVLDGYILKYDASNGVFQAVSPAGAFVSTAISDFTEAAQDAVGSIFTSSTSIAFTYNDAANTITADVTIPPLTAVTTPNGAADYVMIYSAAAGANRKVLLNNLPATGSSGVAFSRGGAWATPDQSALIAPVIDIPITIPIACTIQKVRVLTRGGTGSCVIDVWKDTYANYPPTVGDSITASAKPTIASGVKYEDSTLTGWTTAVAAGDTLIFHLTSTSTFSFIAIYLDLLP